MREGFFKVAFRAELQVGKPAERVRKFDGPVWIFIACRQLLPDHRVEIAAIVADNGGRIDHLNLAITTDRREANFTVSLVADGRDHPRALRKSKRTPD